MATTDKPRSSRKRLWIEPGGPQKGSTSEGEQVLPATDRLLFECSLLLPQTAQYRPHSARQRFSVPVRRTVAHTPAPTGREQRNHRNCSKIFASAIPLENTGCDGREQCSPTTKETAPDFA